MVEIIKVDEVRKILQDESYTYEKFIKYLREKHGNVCKPYFSKKSYLDYFDRLSKNLTHHVDNWCSNEGLEIHHVAEDRFSDLSREKSIENKFKNCCIECSFIYQTPKYLVYCDRIEHAILHLFIVKKK